MNNLIEKLNKMNEECEAEFGIWCPRGGVGTSIAAIAERCGAVSVTFDGPRPSEGCTATLVTPEGTATLRQEWHGGDNSGDWWWVL